MLSEVHVCSIKNLFLSKRSSFKKVKLKGCKQVNFCFHFVRPFCCFVLSVHRSTSGTLQCIYGLIFCTFSWPNSSSHDCFFLAKYRGNWSKLTQVSGILLFKLTTGNFVTNKTLFNMVVVSKNQHLNSWRIPMYVHPFPSHRPWN